MSRLLFIIGAVCFWAGFTAFIATRRRAPRSMQARPSLVAPCPECLAGKCRNCDGTSWDRLQDEPADCPCATADHPRSRT